MEKLKEAITTYLEDQLAVNINALKAYETNIGDVEIQRMREQQAIILRDRITELNLHIAVIKRM